MGAGASVAAAIDEECQRPLDASDVDSPRGISAKNEVVRLRLLLATHANQMGDLLSEDQPQQQEHECQDNGQQTDESLLLSAEARGLGNGCGCDDASGVTAPETMTLAPGIGEYLIACFTNADLDNSGVLSCSEFSRLLREHVDLGLSPEDIQLLLGQAQWMDAKGDVTWQQFVHLAPQLLANLADTSSQAPSATDWCACISTEGTPYYYNKRTQESSWDKPLAVDEGGSIEYSAPTTAELQEMDCEQQADSGPGVEYVNIL